jgi:hypothetical protein
MKRKIAVGDPSAKRASFTRFVLPFAWKAEKVDKPPPESSRFRRATGKDWIHSAIENEQVVDEDRCRYFTPETAELLYHRASWFVLGENEQSTAGSRPVWKTLKVKSGLKDAQHTYQIALRPPALILFEDSPLADKYGKDANGDLLSTGFLVIEAFFPDEKEAPSFKDLLRFNEIFRFWRCPFEKHATEFCAAELNSIYEGIFGSGAAKDRGKNHQNLYTDRWAQLFRHPVINGHEQSFFVMPQEWLNEDASSSGGNRQRNGDPYWLVQPDDRTFTVACAFLGGDGEVNTNLDKKTRTWADVVAAGFEDEDATLPIPGLSGLWVKILNIDRPYWADDDGSCSFFEYRWALERTYRRWASGGSLYGFTSHSMALLAGETVENSMKDPHGEPPLAQHYARFYFDATLLLFYVRVSLFRFSKRLHEVSAEFRDKQIPGDSPRWKDWATHVATVRWQFLQFENLYQFPLLSNQQQHLEMYELQRRWMDIRELYEEIDKEVQSSDNVLTAKLDKQRNELEERRNQLAVMLNILAAVGLGLSVALSCYQISDHSKWWETTLGKWMLARWSPVWWCAVWVILFLFPIGIWWMYDKRRFSRSIPPKQP